jgi:hypothetical protein
MTILFHPSEGQEQRPQAQSLQGLQHLVGHRPLGFADRGIPPQQRLNLPHGCDQSLFQPFGKPEVLTAASSIAGVSRRGFRTEGVVHRFTL